MSVIPVETGIQILRTVQTPFAKTCKLDEAFRATFPASHGPVSAQRPKGSAVNQICYTVYQIDYTLECFRSVGGFTLANISKSIQ